MVKTKMFLVTDVFPYGKGEKPFIIPEIPYLLKDFDLTIITKADKGTIADIKDITELDDRINIIRITDYMKPKKPTSLQVKLRILYLFNKEVRKEFVEIRKGENAAHRMKYMFSYYARARKFLKALKKAGVPIDSQEPIIFYTYWNTYATLALLMCKKKNPNIKVITRTHRYDLYNECPLCGRQPFRAYVNSMIDSIFFISKEGMEYYIENFSKGIKQSIFRLNRLGIINHGTGRCIDKEKGFNLVSCSFAVPVKRVGLIIKALGKIDDSKEVHWTHLGDGQDLESLKSQASELLDNKENITYTFAGFVPNEKVIEYYREHYVDCFINVSSSEGIPVSIMEACSFGIPVIATDVGGMPEIVENNINGLLLCANPTVDEIADAIEQLYDSSKESISVMRNNSRKIWEERYNADKNFLEFVNCIKNDIL